MRRIICLNICLNICYFQGKNNFLSESQFSMFSIYFYTKFLFVGNCAQWFNAGNSAAWLISIYLIKHAEKFSKAP